MRSVDKVAVLVESEVKLQKEEKRNNTRTRFKEVRNLRLVFMYGGRFSAATCVSPFRIEFWFYNAEKGARP